MNIIFKRPWLPIREVAIQSPVKVVVMRRPWRVAWAYRRPVTVIRGRPGNRYAE